MLVFRTHRMFNNTTDGTTGSMVDVGSATTGESEATADAANTVTTQETVIHDPGTMDATVTSDGNELPKTDIWAEYKDDSGKILGKYDDGKALVEGYKELTKKVREKAPEPPAKPEDYSFSFGEDPDLKDMTLTNDDPLIARLAPVAHKLKVTNEQMSGLAAEFLKMGLEGAKRGEQEKAKLGDEADTIINTVVGYAKKANSPGARILAELAGTNAEAIKALNDLIGSTKEAAIPTKVNVNAGKTRQQLEDAAHEYRKSVSDFMDNPIAKRKYEAMLDEAFAQS